MFSSLHSDSPKCDLLSVTSPNIKFIEFIEFNDNYGKTRVIHQRISAHTYSGVSGFIPLVIMDPHLYYESYDYYW